MSPPDTQMAEGPLSAARLAAANINPATGLATDYLNHFNEAIMLLEMVPVAPECIDDFMSWRPVSYREHFAHSRFKDRQIAIAAYDHADTAARETLEELADTMNAILSKTHDEIRRSAIKGSADALAARAAASLRPLVARAGAVINGEEETMSAQAMVDGFFKT
ncbi:MAG TPA: hypothetical protein VFB45_10885 [Pseudolabrys sp.]|nr:hypothetical protein [Pseudolabrys sp.]